MYKTDILFFKVKTLCVLLRPTNTDFLVMHKFLRHANFFLKLIVRSMAQHILESGRIKVYEFSLSTTTEQFSENLFNQMQRQERFHMDYMRNVETLVETISPHIQHKYKDLPDETRNANSAIAEFVKVNSSTFICFHIFVTSAILWCIEMHVFDGSRFCFPASQHLSQHLPS